jgi:hypothetical protein
MSLSNEKTQPGVSKQSNEAAVNDTDNITSEG